MTANLKKKLKHSKHLKIFHKVKSHFFWGDYLNKNNKNGCARHFLKSLTPLNFIKLKFKNSYWDVPKKSCAARLGGLRPQQLTSRGCWQTALYSYQCPGTSWFREPGTCLCTFCVPFMWGSRGGKCSALIRKCKEGTFDNRVEAPRWPTNPGQHWLWDQVFSQITLRDECLRLHWLCYSWTTLQNWREVSNNILTLSCESEEKS